MRFCTDVKTSTKPLYSGYGELLDIPPRQYRSSRNSAIEFKGNLNKIEELKRKIEELETAL
ncbi:hypothetical protein Goarm_013259 [Gossypium armourianum]|uniref:Uncharacterized protein n=1 Tax=Gossypium armourianum TaxID=34283 RepID=A0A7J9J397_9ROSI|nr:hypothetical protein [Gossypium armourianum]